jgi:hypothetical protein
LTRTRICAEPPISLGNSNSSTDPVVLRQKFNFRFPEKYMIVSARPAPIRGALRDRHERWPQDAMDAVTR